MKKLVTGALAALTLGGALVAATAPAQAQPFRGGYYHGGYRGPGVGAAVGAGILGLAVGAAIAHPAYAYPGPYYGPAYAYPAPYYGPVYAPVYGYGYGYGYHPYWRHYGYRR
jgi:hypothetical protein